MSRLNHAGDFIFGIVLLAATPIFVFFGTGLMVALLSLFGECKMIDVIGRWVVLGISLASFWGACLWRKKHRRIPISVFPIEIIVSIVFGVGFMVVLVLALYVVAGGGN